MAFCATTCEDFNARRNAMHIRIAPLLVAAQALGISLALFWGAVVPVYAQDTRELGRAEALERHFPELYDLVDRIERAHAVMFDALIAARTNGPLPTPGFGVDLTESLIPMIQGAGTSEASPRFAVLGARAADVIQWSQAFQREVLSILADPSLAEPDAALTDAVRRYQRRADVALPTVPKNMDVLYGHAYATEFRSNFAELDGLLWAGHWLRLAATEPLTDLPAGQERTAGVDTVSSRYIAKLSRGEPPHAFPTEIPLAPAIAPGLIWVSAESAVIWDNTSMMLEVLADVVAAAEDSNLERAIDATIDFFLDPTLSVTNQDEWEIMALRHGIFFQGGFPLAVMTKSERNVSGHAAHLMGGGMLRAIPGMPPG